MELCGGERGLIAVLGGDDAADKRGIGNQCYLGCGRGNALPLQHGQTVVDAPNGFPVLRAQIAEQAGLHFGKGEGSSIVCQSCLRNTSRQIVTSRQCIIAAGGKCAGFAVVTALNPTSGIAVGNLGTAASINTGGVIFRGNGTRVVAIDNFGVAAVVAANNTGSAVFGRYAAGVIAAGDLNYGIPILAVAQNAAHIAATGNIGLVAAVGNGVVCTNGTTDNAARVAVAAGNRALNDDIFDLGILNHTKETGILGANVQTGDGVALPVKAALIGVYAGVTGLCANGRKGIAAQINIICEFRVELCSAVCFIDGIGQPCQLSTVFNLIGRFHRTLTGGILFFNSVPRSGGDQGNGNGFVLGNGEGFAHLGVARGFDRVGVFAVREEIAAVGLCNNSLAVPENGDGGVDVRRGDVKGDRALFYGRESDGLADRAAVDGDLAILCPIAEGGDSVVIFAVGESERPVAAGMRTGLPINGDLGICGGNRESDVVGGDLPTEDGVAVIDARRSGDERLAQRGGQRLQFVGGFGCGVGVGAEGVEVVAVGDASAALFTEGGLYIAVASDGSCGVAVGRRSSRIFDSASNAAGITGRRRDCNIATVIGIFQRYGVIQIADQSADIAAACDLAEVCAGVYRFCAGGFYAAYDATNVCAAGDICFIHTVFHRTRTGQLTNDTCGVASPFNAATYGQVLHGAAVDIAEQGLIGRSAVDLQILDLIALTVKGAFVLVGITGFPNRCPILITKINVICQLGTDTGFAAIVYLRGKPTQLASIGDQIRVFRRACARGLFGHGNGDVLAIAFLGFRQVDGAALRNICRTVK